MTVNRVRVVKFRVNPAEDALLRTLADAEKRKPSEVIREALRDLGERRGLWPLPPPEARQEMRT